HFGIHRLIEKRCLLMLELTITAALQNKTDKPPTLMKLRIITEVVKHLIRNMAELNIITQKMYLSLEIDLQELSKMTNGWLKYLNI
ncbi:MAG: hypothetical protein UW06_C0049G0001, partial [Parcubacteria group bacterium GW2011_GWE1_43_8]